MFSALVTSEALGKSIKMFFVLVVGHADKVGLVNGYPHNMDASIEGLIHNNSESVCYIFVANIR